VWLATLALAERLLVLATARALFARSLGVKLEVGVALGTVFTLRRVLVRSLAARAEADLTNRAIRSVLEGDVLRPSVLPGEDAHAELGQGVYMSSLQLTEALPALAADLVAAILLTIVVFAIEPFPIVVGATAVMVVAAVGLMWSRSRLQKAARVAWALHEKLQEALVDALDGRLEIVASGVRAGFAAMAHQRAQAWGSAGVQMASSSLITGRLPLLAIAGAVAVVVTVDSRLQGIFSVSLADLALFASITPAFAGVAQGVLGLAQAEPWMRAVALVIGDARPRLARKLAPAMPAPIAFETVSFRYDGADADALSAIDFKWGDERVVALLGANGSGKSTWLRLLLALGSPQVGKVRVGGEDLAEFDADSWRRSIAFLPQRPYLALRTDVRATVRLLVPAASDERIASALDCVGLLETLSRAHADPLAVRVDTLSVGQRQRIALARMLCRDASLFVLDEPDANLDRAGIVLVADLVRKLSRDSRVLIAAHTPELVAVADRVIELDRGRVVRDDLRGLGVS
jgi:ABC-type bacteriocin/lantibiotic exporter with double-glycine peptidase domain